MLAIRFQRTGRKNDPSFRIIVSEKARHPKGGKPLEVVGSYNPKTKHTVIAADRVKYWISKGAQASGTVTNLLITKGVLPAAKKVNVRNTKTAPKKRRSRRACGRGESRNRSETRRIGGFFRRDTGPGRAFDPYYSYTSVRPRFRGIIGILLDR